MHFFFKCRGANLTLICGLASEPYHKNLYVCVCIRHEKCLHFQEIGLTLRPSLSLSGLQPINLMGCPWKPWAIYLYKKVNSKLYKWAVPTWEAYTSRCVDIKRAWFKWKAKLLVGAPLKEVALLLPSPVRRSSTEAVRKITSCYIS